MRKPILIWIALSLLLVNVLPARAQEDAPPCTAADLAPLSAIVTGMADDAARAGSLAVDPLLGWRAQIAALDVPDCAGITDALLQLQLAADELLIGALLLDRVAADPATAEGLSRTAAVAFNTGLTNLMGMRFALAGEGEAAAPPFGELTGAEVIAAFTAAGLPLTDVTAAIAPLEEGAPQAELERLAFALPGGGTGQVLAFADARGRDAWLAYLFQEVRAAGYLYTARNVIVTLSPAVEQATALRFRDALRGLE